MQHKFPTPDLLQVLIYRIQSVNACEVVYPTCITALEVLIGWQDSAK